MHLKECVFELLLHVHECAQLYMCVHESSRKGSSGLFTNC